MGGKVRKTIAECNAFVGTFSTLRLRCYTRHHAIQVISGCTRQRNALWKKSTREKFTYRARSRETVESAAEGSYKQAGLFERLIRICIINRRGTIIKVYLACQSNQRLSNYLITHANLLLISRRRGNLPESGVLFLLGRNRRLRYVDMFTLSNYLSPIISNNCRQMGASALNCAANVRKKFQYEIKLVDRSFVTTMTLIFI